MGCPCRLEGDHKIKLDEARIKECDETLARFRTVALDPVTTPSALMAEAGTVMQHLADLRACLADPE
jgi:hypothetical protein